VDKTLTIHRSLRSKRDLMSSRLEKRYVKMALNLALMRSVFPRNRSLATALLALP
jgi:hypothetical protein